MTREYTLDTQAAKDANSGSKRIKDAGKYVGKFTAAWYEQNDKGTESVHFLFESNEGQEAGPLALYTHNSKGEALPSYKMLNAIMTCLKVRGIKTVQGKIELYDFNAGGMVTKDKPTYPELSNKPIGLVLQREEYQKQDGSIGERMIIAGPFDPATSKMAAEILNNTEAKALDNVLRYIEANPVKALRGAKPQATHADASNAEFPDDEIPFAPLALRRHW
jgi:hypothetical protein